MRTKAEQIAAIRTDQQFWRDLATGTDLVFRPLGAAELRGVPGEWELFEASLA